MKETKLNGMLVTDTGAIIDIDRTQFIKNYVGLYNELFGTSFEGSSIWLFSSKQMDEALTTLTLREATIIILKFGLADGKKHNLTEIGKVVGTSRERVKDALVKALRKLRHPVRSKAIQAFTFGRLAWYPMTAEEEKCIETLENDICNALSSNIEEFDMSRLDIVKQILEKEIDFVIDANTPIENLMLNVRTFNCLKRAGINTLGEIPTEKEELLKIRNLGTRCTDDLLKVLEDPNEYVKAVKEDQAVGIRSAAEIIAMYKSISSVLDDDDDDFFLS